MWLANGGGAFGFAPWGGQLTAAPALAWVPTPRGASLLAVANGSDHSLWVRSGGYGWAPLSPFSSCSGTPAIAVTGPAGASVLTVACRGLDDGLWVGQTQVTAGAKPMIGGFVPLGGSLTGGPAVAEVGGQLTFAAPGGGGLTWTRTSASGWNPTGLTCFGH